MGGGLWVGVAGASPVDRFGVQQVRGAADRYSYCRVARAPSAMAPAPRSLLSPPTLLLLLLLLSLALLGARAEPAAGSAVPAQSRCLRRGRAGGVFVSWAVTFWVGTGGRATGTGTGSVCPPSRDADSRPVGRPCVDCHAFEFMQRALQDLRKTAYSLDARVSSQGQGGLGLAGRHPKI